MIKKTPELTPSAFPFETGKQDSIEFHFTSVYAKADDLSNETKRRDGVTIRDCTNELTGCFEFEKTQQLLSGPRFRMASKADCIDMF